MHNNAENLIKDIRFENIDMKIRQSELNETFGGNFDLRPALSNEFGVFEHDIPGFFATGVNNLEIDDFKLDWLDEMEDFHTNGIHVVESENLLLSGYSGRQANNNPNHAAICLEKVNNYLIRNCSATPGTQIFLKHNALKGDGILNNNRVTNSRRVYYPKKPI